MRKQGISIITLLLISALMLIIGGYDRLGWNHPVQLPWVLRFNHPDLFPDDPLVDASKYNCSLHWYGVAFLSRYVPLDSLLLILYILSRLLLVAAVYSLARALVPSLPTAAWASALLFALQPRPLVGGGTIVRPYYEHSGLAIAVMLFAAAAFVNRKRYLWAVLVGLLFYLNAIYAVASLLYFGIALPVVDPSSNSRSLWLRALIVTLFTSLPSLLWIVVNARQHVGDWEAWIAVIYATQGYHVFPLTWSTQAIVVATLFFVTAVVTALHVRHHASLCAKLSLVWSGVFLFWISMAFIGGYFVQSRFLVSFQPVRATDFWFAVTAVMMVCLATVGLQRSLHERSPLQALFFAGVWAFDFALWRLLYVKECPKMAFMQTAALLVAIPLTMWCYRRTVNNSHILLQALLQCYVGVVVGVALSTAYQRGSILVQPGTPIYEQIALWAKRNTSPKESFLVPLQWGHFRIWSCRTVFVLKNDSALILAAPSYTQHWISRLRLIGLDVVSLVEPALRKRFFRGQLEKLIYLNNDLWDRLYQQVNEETAARLAREYGIDYWVIRAEQVTRFPEVFRHRGWKVVRITAGELSRASSLLTSQHRSDNRKQQS